MSKTDSFQSCRPTRRHHRRRRRRARHRLAARRPRRGHGVRSRQGRIGRQPRGGRHAGGLLRSRARRRGAGRARPRKPGALAGLCRGTFARERHRCRIAARGHLVLALTADDQAEIAHRLEFQRQLDLPLEWLSAAATRAREPHLAGKIAGALFSPEDHQVDNRKLVQALRIAAEAAGATICEHRPVKEIVVQGGRAKGVAARRTERVVAGRYRGARGRRLVARHRRITAGPAAAGAADQGPDADAAHGCGGAAPLPRGLGAGRLSGAATRRPADRRRDRRGKGLRRDDHRRRRARRCSKPPGARCRRSRNCRSRKCGSVTGRAAATTRRSSDRGPLEGLFYATGHHRNGILLAPVTADAMARLILDDVVEPAIKPFGLERFLPARAAE